VNQTIAAGYPKRGDIRSRNRGRDLRERLIRWVLLTAASVSVLTTVGIILALAADTLRFFQQVSLLDFLTDTQWTPLFSDPHFGIWPLITATALISAIALVSE
jgi:phosphate transport system permease protein